MSRSYNSHSETIWAVRDVTLAIPAGRLLVVLGASGSGKSTLLNLIAGLDTPSAGRICVEGTDIRKLGEPERSKLRRTHVGVVFQDHNLIADFTALENVMLPLEASKVPRLRARQQAVKALRDVGMTGLEDRLPHMLSGGQSQRVGVARAMVGDRRVILADEPTGSLDSANTRLLFQLFSDLTQLGITVILATHDLASLDYADGAVQLLDGHVASVGFGLTRPAK